MAFTDEQKVQIRFFLGYPFPFQELNPRFESALVNVGGNTAAKAIVESILKKLVTFYGMDPANPDAPAKIDQAVDMAGVKKVESLTNDSVEFGSSTGNSASGGVTSAVLAAQNDAARQLVSALSSHLGVAIGSNVFGRNGYTSDAWAHRSSWMSRSPRVVLMGAG